MSRILFTTVSLLALNVAAAEENEALVLRERHGRVMGSEFSLKAIGAEAALLDRALEEAEGELRRIEDVMTDWRPSPLTRLNDGAGSGPQKVPEELAAIISRSVELHKLTDGAFDVTYASAGQLWNYKRPDFVFPTAEAVAEARQHIDASRVRVDSKAMTVDLPAHMRIGLGGIAQGYGADRAMDILRRHGIRHALVDISGDLKILGLKLGKPWEVAIKHPRERDRALAVLRLSNTCVTTSGDYERFFERNGKRYHHIIDPRTGYPSDGCMSATVVAQNSEYGDALATALCVLNPDKGMALVERLEHIEAILVDKNGVVHVSSGLKKLFKEGSETSSEATLGKEVK